MCYFVELRTSENYMIHMIFKVFLPLTIVSLRGLRVMASEMKYIHHEKGGPENMSIRVTNIPTLRDKEVLLKVYATAVNRADTLQRKGLYPPPPGESEILGLEAAGVVEKLGPSCTGTHKVGDKCMALLAGGGYAEYVAVPEDTLMPMLPHMKFTMATAIPEVWLTAYQLLHVVGALAEGETVLIHAGASGVGTAAIQLCRQAGCKPIVTAGSQSKLEAVLGLGAMAGFNYKEGNFSDKVLAFTGGKGVDLILDCIGASFYEQNMQCIKVDGHWVLYGLLGGGNITGDVLSQILRKRVRISGTTLRARPLHYKKNLVDMFVKDAMPLFGAGSVAFKPIIDRVYPFFQVAEAHRHMESNENIGKIVLQVRDEDTGIILHDEL